MERRIKESIVVNQKTMLIIRIAAAVILLCLTAVLIQKDNIMAAENPDSVPAGDYYEGDIAVINSIIEENGLEEFEKDDLLGWETSGMVVWNQESPKRIVSLQIKKICWRANWMSAV